jgi:hypothetical protein
VAKGITGGDDFRIIWYCGLTTLLLRDADVKRIDSSSPTRASAEIADRLLIGRLELDPQAMRSAFPFHGY